VNVRFVASIRKSSPNVERDDIASTVDTGHCATCSIDVQALRELYKKSQLTLESLRNQLISLDLPQLTGAVKIMYASWSESELGHP